MSEEVATKESVLSAEQMQSMLATMKPNKSVNMSADMLTMEPGEELRAIAIGMCRVSKFNKPDELTDAVELLTADGMKKSADKVLVSTLRDKKMPVAVLIECIGMADGKNGKYREFNIFPLEA